MSAGLAPIALALFESLYPLKAATESPEYREHLLRQLGWDEAAAEELFVLGPQILDWWTRGEELVATLDEATQAKKGELQFASAMLLLEIAFELGDALAARKGRPSAGPLKQGVLDELWSDLVLALPSYLLARWMRLHKPQLYWLLRVADIIELEHIQTNNRARIDADVPRLHLDRLGPLVSDTEAYLQARYDWGFGAKARNHPQRHDSRPAASVRHRKLLVVLHRLFSDFGVRARLGEVRPRFIGAAGAAPGEDLELFDAEAGALEHARQLSLPLIRGRAGQGPWFELGLELLPIPGSRGQDRLDGFHLRSFSRGGQTGSFALDQAGTWTLDVSGELDASGALAVELLPEGVRFVAAPPETKLELRLRGYPKTPWTLLGSNTGTRLELRGCELGAAYERVGQDDELRLFYEPKAKTGGPGMAMILSPGEGDGFIRSLLGDAELEIIVDLGVVWSSLSGLRLRGEAGFCVTLDLGLSLGPVTIERLKLCLSAGAEGLSLLAAVTASARLGPLVCSVEEIGVELGLDWGGQAEAGGRFAGLTPRVAFKPPTGIGLGIESQLVRAGGYLEFDGELGEYGGTATIGIGPLTLSAVGMLNSQLPEPPGWSLVLSICAEFIPIPLGFGFTLNGIGGLIGVGRSIDSDAIRRRLAEGGLDAIMFPEDPVAAGPLIMEAVREMFPVARGQTVFGPMVKIGWGAPTLIEADLAVLIELPDPVRVLVLGQIASVLPSKQLPIVELHLDAIGEFNLSAASLALDAVLYDSWILGLSLSGSLALRANFGANPEFLFSLGGFHPNFTAPKGFPDMRRLSIGLEFPFGKDAVRIESRAYLALTTNTIQYGARVELALDLDILTIVGGGGFDCIVQFSPFEFTGLFDAHAAVLLGKKNLLAILVAGKLSGPKPWHFEGRASFKVLSKEWGVDVAVSLAGKKQKLELERVHVAAKVRKALQERGAWAQTGGGASGVVLVEPTAARAAPADEERAQLGPNELPRLSLRPDLDLEVRQRVAPLGLELDKYGNHDITGPSQVAITWASFGDQTVPGPGLIDIEDHFAPADFYAMSKKERLHAPSFEKLSAGKRFVLGGLEIGSSRDHDLDHEYSVIDRDHDALLARASAPRGGERRRPSAHAVAKFDLRPAALPTKRRFPLAGDALQELRVTQEAWQVADLGSNWRSSKQRSYSAARAFMNAHQREHPHLKGRLRVIRAGEGLEVAS